MSKQSPMIDLFQAPNADFPPFCYTGPAMRLRPYAWFLIAGVVCGSLEGRGAIHFWDHPVLDGIQEGEEG
jgi:hypothetical protein